MKRIPAAKRGFTLMELLIVVAIIAILVAIAIPTITSSLHKAKEAADMANVRAYYATLQSDYLLTGEFDPSIPDEMIWSDTITFPNGSQVKLQVGEVSVLLAYEGKFEDRTPTGYQVAYYCKKEHNTLILGTGG